MTQNADNTSPVSVSTQKARTYYELLGLHPSASVIDIRRAYRDLSKRYHPDTAQLAPAIAKQEFQTLNEAYATLSSPERRAAYDRAIGYSSVPVLQPLPPLSQEPFTYDPLASAYIDGSDRPLSAGELFALFILAVTFVGCLLLAITVGLARGEMALKAVVVPPDMVSTAPAISEAARSAVVDPQAAPQAGQPAPSLAQEESAAIPSPAGAPARDPSGVSSDALPEATSAPVRLAPPLTIAPQLPDQLTNGFPAAPAVKLPPESPRNLPDRAPEPGRVE